MARPRRQTTRLRTLREAEGGGDAPVDVRGDRTVPCGEVMRVMGRVTQAGIGRVSFIAEAEPGGAAAVTR